ncbi:MAG: hypothetical protein WB615_06650 [Candidatus Tumulicola sp.]
MQPATVAPPALDPYGLFLQARSAVSSTQYPHRIDYTIAVTGLDGTVERSNHYRASYRSDEDQVNVAPISQEEAAKPPPVPHGFNFALTAAICGGRCETGSATMAFPAGHPATSPDLIGVPLLAPTYMFGLTYQPQGERTAQIVLPSNIPVIAVVSSRSRDYAVTLLDSPVVEGALCYHLRLTPLRKPKANRLRELWIGTNDYLPRKAIVAGNFTLVPFVDVPWTVDFSVVAGAPFIRQESANATLYLTHRRVVRDALISFENVAVAGAAIYDVPLIAPDTTTTTLTEPDP